MQEKVKIPNAPFYRITKDGTVSIGKKILKQSKDTNGRCQVGIIYKGKNVSKDVATLVMESFVGPKQPGFDIHHLNKNRADNNLNNLVYLTHKEHLRLHRKTPTKYCVCGKEVPRKRKVFCSGECKHRTLYESRTCVVCGREYEIRKSLIKYGEKHPRYKNGMGVYCSILCRNNRRFARLNPAEARLDLSGSLSDPLISASPVPQNLTLGAVCDPIMPVGVQ